MGKYGYIRVDNISLSAEVFNKVCDRLKLITSHFYQNRKTLYIYGIDDNKTMYNIDRGALTKQSQCFLDAIGYYTKHFDDETRNGFNSTYFV